MRTVSFSDNRVQKLLNEEFICLRLNTRGDPTAGQSFSHAPRDPAGPCLRGNGRQNVQALFMTPSCEIFHVVTGFVGPDDLQQELEWALVAYRKIGEQNADRKTAVRDAHVEFLTQAGFSDAEIEQPSGVFPEMLVGAAPRLPLGADGMLSFDRALEGVARSQILADHRFVIEHALLPMSRFKPETLVGNGNSFFGSTRFGEGAGDFGPRAKNRGDR